MLPLDADRDGDLDLRLVDATRPPMLWRAEGAEDRAHLTLQLRQPGANPYAIGAEVVVRPSATAPPQLRLLHAHTLYMGGPAPEVHFGLGDHAGPIAEVRVRWPDGAETVHGPIVGEHTTIFRSEEEPE